MSDANGKSYWCHDAGGKQINVFTQNGALAIALHDKGKPWPKACIVFDEHNCRFQFGESSVEYLDTEPVYRALWELLDRAGEIAEGIE